MAVQLVGDDRLACQDARLSMHRASEATLVIAAATSCVNYRDVSGDPVAIVRARTARAAAKSYAQLKRAHVDEHARLSRPCRSTGAS